MAGGQRSSLLLPPMPQSAPAARRFATTTLAGWQVAPEVVECAELLLSELVANAVRHAGTEVTVELALHDRLVRVAVRDRLSTAPTRLPPPVLAESGRGLELVEQLASHWGVEQWDGGKSVWFELAG